MKLLKVVEPQIPIYHTCAMRESFEKDLALVKADLKPHQVRFVYRHLTGNCFNEIDSSKIDSRVNLAIETEDPDLVFHLRHLKKGKPGGMFDVFFDHLQKMLEEVTVAHDRRHGITLMAEYLSVQDLIERVKEKLLAGSNVAIPSELTVIYTFAPPNMHKALVQYYTGRVNLKHTIQRRQLRSFHINAHCCAALFKYIQDMSIKFKETSLFLSCDDKAKIDHGEPCCTLSTGVRERKSIVPLSSSLQALDHDVNQKGSLQLSIFRLI